MDESDRKAEEREREFNQLIAEWEAAGIKVPKPLPEPKPRYDEEHVKRLLQK